MKKYEEFRNVKLEEDEKKLVEDIEKYGLAITHVLEDESGPEFSYSIGLFDNYNHPEIIVIGLPHDVTQILLNNIAIEIKSGKVFEEKKYYSDMIDNFKVYFKKVNLKYYLDYFGWAQWYYNNDKFPVLQMIWPDKNNKYPWDMDFNEKWVWKEPILE